MKLLVLIFAFYITWLSAYPCYDGNCGRDTCVAGEYKHDHDDEDTDSAQDTCTPFCVNGCCLVHVLSPENKPSVSYVHHTSNPTVSYLADFKSIEVAPVWQPPQVT